MAQGVQPLVRNEVTHNSPDIQVPGLFGLTERTYGDYPYRSAPLVPKGVFHCLTLVCLHKISTITQ